MSKYDNWLTPILLTRLAQNLGYDVGLVPDHDENNSLLVVQTPEGAITWPVPTDLLNDLEGGLERWPGYQGEVPNLNEDERRDRIKALLERFATAQVDPEVKLSLAFRHVERASLDLSRFADFFVYVCTPDVDDETIAEEKKRLEEADDPEAAPTINVDTQIRDYSNMEGQMLLHHLHQYFQLRNKQMEQAENGAAGSS